MWWGPMGVGDVTHPAEVAVAIGALEHGRRLVETRLLCGGGGLRRLVCVREETRAARDKRMAGAR